MKVCRQVVHASTRMRVQMHQQQAEGMRILHVRYKKCCLHSSLSVFIYQLPQCASATTHSATGTSTSKEIGITPSYASGSGTSSVGAPSNCAKVGAYLGGVPELNNRCIVCNVKYPTWHSLLHHMRKHESVPKEYLENCRLPNRMYECVVCGRQKRHLSCLRQHCAAHSTSYPFKCPFCPKSYRTIKHFLNHYRKYHRSMVRKRFQCSQCNCTYSHMSSLKTHLLRRHSGHDAKARCEVCFKRVLPHSLQGHYFLHTGEKPFRCETCDKPFALKQKLKRHIKYVHQGLRPAPKSELCQVCGLKVLVDSYESHMRRHTGEPTNICSICSKPFYKVSRYVIHMERMHIRNKQFKCPVCGKGFGGQSDVTQHVRVHLDEKPFKCQVCGKAFKWKHKVGDHMKTHSEERPFKCDLCGEAFKWKHNLSNHNRAKHK